ncbi:protein SHORT-ROOT-like [Silene latifolia]|uniref:protein SHORT-ROOT-like n=1 Tax=Silene latifolia TaxID=37657 RepID=UPI003D77A252
MHELAKTMHHSVDTSFPLQLPGKWIINNHQTTTKPLTNHQKDTTLRHGSSKPCFRWSTALLLECATAINEKNPSKTNHLLWLLNELASPYGDRDQRLAYYFLQALFTKANNKACLWYETLKCVEEKYYCFNDRIKLKLKFQEVSPWTTFGHVASNGVILEALEGDEIKNLHIIDLSNTLCTQWPTLIEALATRFDETPSLRLTLVVTSNLEEILVKEVSQRMEKFARLMGVTPFKLSVISGLDYLEELKIEDLGLQNDETIVVNCIQALQRVEVDKRGVVLDKIRSINPKIVTIVEEEANLTTTRNDFPKNFEECLRFYDIYFEMLEESFGLISSDRIRLERERSRNISRVLACDDQIKETYWMPNIGSEWSKMILMHGFLPCKYSDEVVGDVKALLRRYRDGWNVIELHKDDHNHVGIHLTWKDEPIIWACAWKPN